MNVIVLDDYQGVSRSFADWSRVDRQCEVTVVRRHLAGDELVEVLSDAEIVVVMRERTPFPDTLIAALPRLRLLVTTGRQTQSSIFPRARSIECSSAGRVDP